MIKEFIGKITGSVGFGNKTEAITIACRVTNYQTDKINEMIKVINSLEVKVEKLEKELKKYEN